VAAPANHFGSFSNALAVGAAIFSPIARNAATCGIRAFFRLRHGCTVRNSWLSWPVSDLTHYMPIQVRWSRGALFSLLSPKYSAFPPFPAARVFKRMICGGFAAPGTCPAPQDQNTTQPGDRSPSCGRLKNPNSVPMRRGSQHLPSPLLSHLHRIRHAHSGIPHRFALQPPRNRRCNTVIHPRVNSRMVHSHISSYSP
jgi:hypothetical protein